MVSKDAQPGEIVSPMSAGGGFTRTGIGTVGWYTFVIADPAKADSIARSIDGQFANSSAETKTSSEKPFARSFAEQVGDTGAILGSIGAVVFFVILLIVGNTMAQSVRERTAEINEGASRRRRIICPKTR